MQENVNVNAIVEQEGQSRPMSPQKQIRDDLDKLAEQLRHALPSHVSVEKFQRVAMTAIQSDSDLLYADRQSLFESILRAAADGLLPDKREGAFVIFRANIAKKGEPKNFVNKVQWMPMIAGIQKKVRQSGEISGISAHVVYQNDDFVWSLGDDESIAHTPPPFGNPRGEPVGVYAVATLRDGFKIREVMDRDQIEKVRKVSKTGEWGPWKDWWEEMAKKTVIRRLSKRLPMSTDIEGVIAGEDTDADLAHSAAAVLSAPRMTRHLLAKQASGEALTNEADEQPAHDAETGELVEQEAAREATPADHPAHARAQAIIVEIVNCANVGDLNALEDERTLEVSYMPDDIAEKVMGVFSARLDELTPAQ